MDTVLHLHGQLLDEADRLAPLPESAIELASAVVDPRKGPRDFAQIIGKDPTLSGLVLREANSAASGARQEIGSLDIAVARLGGGRVLKIATDAHVAGQLEAPLPGYLLAGSELRRHSVGAAIAAEVLIGRVKGQCSPDVIAAALLHDLGKTLLNVFLDPDASRPMIEHGTPAAAFERELLDVDHAEVGGYVAEAWGLPLTIVDGIRHHHHPEASTEAAVVCLADALARRLTVPDSYGELAHDGNDVQAIEILGVADQIDEIEAKIVARFELEGLA